MSNKNRITDFVNLFERKILQEELLSKNYCRCRKCNSREGLTIHHKKPWSKFPELRYDPNNCVILCKKCHRKLHEVERGKERNGVQNLAPLQQE